MQVLKDEVREAILRAALKEFTENSYEDASMRHIAKSAEMTVGNIYRYFDSKDALFNALMEPVWKNVTKAVFSPYHQSGDPNMITEIIAAIMDIYRKYSRELYILLYNSKGSQYGDVREGLIRIISKRINDEMTPLLAKEGREIDDPFLFDIIAHAIVDSIFLVIREAGDDFERFGRLMEKTMTVMVKDLYERL